MARLPRLTVAGYPHHIIQRGNNRQSIFASSRDYEYLLELIREHARASDVAVHAYVLMTNHLHLLVTPATQEGIPRLMQSVGRRYVRYFNQHQQRTGTLWEGRYRSTVIEAEAYLLTCMAYMDLNPVRAGMVDQAQDYAWSSHRHYAGLAQDKLITPHPLFWDLANTPFAREAAYVEFVRSGVPARQQESLTQSALRGWALGSKDYLEDLQKRTQRRVAEEKAGRPVAKSTR